MSDVTRISVSRAQFATQLQTVARGLPSKNVVSTIDGILMEGRNGEIILTATDLETQISASMSSLETGTAEVRTLLPTQIVGMVKALPGDNISLAFDGDSVSITAGATNESNLRLLTLDSAGFPAFERKDDGTDGEVIFRLGVGEFKRVLRQIIFAVSTDVNNQKFTCVNMELISDTLHLAASDTYRLADTSCTVERIPGNDGDIKMLVPAKPLYEFLRIVQKTADDANDQVVEIVCREKSLSIKTGAIKIATRLWKDDKYPETRKLFPTTFGGTVTLDTVIFRQALERTLIFTEKSATSIIDLSTEEPSLVGTDMSINVISAYGSLKERINVEYNGEGFRATLNARYVHEWLKNCRGEHVQIQHGGPNHACVALDTAFQEFRYLILAIRRAN